MDSNRKSAVSSYYGGKNSFDALKDEGDAHFLPEGRPSAGYNPESYYNAGRQEPLKGGKDEEVDVGMDRDDGWDVYADFNNAGPRYSTGFGQNGAGYRQISTPDRKNDGANTLGPVEMVTVPALGPEWSQSEMRGMTKASKRENRAETVKAKWKGWNRNESGCCGGFLTKKVLVFVVFGLCIATGFVLAFTIPRVPSLAFNNNSPLVAANGTFNSSIPTQFSRAPANFSFPSYVDIQIGTNGNFLPLAFNSISAQVFDLTTNRLIATGNTGHLSFPAKALSPYNLPLNFSYVASNDTDQTWMIWYAACKSPTQYVGGKRPGVDFKLILDMDIAGLVGSHSSSTEISDANCPIQLPANAA